MRIDCALGREDLDGGEAMRFAFVAQEVEAQASCLLSRPKLFLYDSVTRVEGSSFSIST